MDTKPTDRDRFNAERTAARRSMLSEVLHFLGSTKKWWLLPIIVVFAFFGLLMLVGGTAAAPFIYTLF